ncbi:UDP-2,3-diacylglucosamine diphosphatase [Tenuifilum thalassicum]|uniref:UDP-2,3-diacylglucosamine diphosphatase n=1 Tax=Tenuifilum thalassicum TaxID=2590900 RepID=A0A7D3XCU2_9BACT|nr:UDP-2,3-diacylglucosamine diphosphatase [Tenuifilum thalassicum]QKG79292.1 UDP-2,3-diacylglucosamine diphosphatase [Tenuifilum thalassicum]
MSQDKKIYFASDLHLGLPNLEKSLPREKMFVSWLDEIYPSTSELYLLGDIFDFWFEYRRVVPKGYTRFLGKIAQFTDSGIPVHFFTGNHDVWMFDYFEKELGVTIHREPIVRELLGARFLLAHGDGLGPGDPGYKLLKRIFTSPTLQWLFAKLHPNFSLWFGNQWSVSSRYSKEITHNFRGEEEQITKFSRIKLSDEHFDFFIFGHWHSPIIYPLADNSNLTVLGDWLVSNTYGVWDGEQFNLMRYNPNGQDEVISSASLKGK